MFTGTLIAVPDVSKLRIGSQTSLVRDSRGDGSDGPKRNKELETGINYALIDTIFLNLE